jgi:hypothetical protein
VENYAFRDSEKIRCLCGVLHLVYSGSLNASVLWSPYHSTKFLALLGPCLFVSPIGSLKIVLVRDYTPSSKIMFCTYVFYLVF